jgi:hypothetical protein
VKTCPSCACQLDDSVLRCPQCGSFYSRIAAIIAEEEEQEQLQTFKGQCKRILQSGDIKNELLAEVRKFKAGLSKKSVFTLYVIMAFVFALVVSVL